jgi:hypothetical protein
LVRCAFAIRREIAQVIAAAKSGIDAVDGSSSGTRVPRMWELLRLPRFRGASHADSYDGRS